MQSLREFYGLIHAKFLTTPTGVSLVREKYLNGFYGHCPRILCNKQVVLPIGLSDDLKYSRVKVSGYLTIRFFARNVRKFTSLRLNAQKSMEPSSESLFLNFS